MDTLEYRRIITNLDKELEQAKKAWEAKARRESLVQRQKLLLHWEDGLVARQAEFAKYSATPSVDIETELTKLRGEMTEIDGQLAGKEPPGAPPPTRLDPAIRADLEGLIENITLTINDGLPERPFQERWLRLQYWSILWRILAIKAGDFLVRVEGSPFKAAYARIMWALGATGVETLLEALSQNCHQEIEKWESGLRSIERRLEEAIHAREEEDRQAKLAEEAYTELCVFFQSAPLDGEDAVTMFRHLARKSASFEHMRPEIAALCGSKRDILGEEFAFLWPADDGEAKEEPEEPGKKLSNRDIAARICRRLKSKAIYGACHAPQDMVVRGFASHDYGRAEEAVDELVRAGIVRRRRTGIGLRLSLEPGKLRELSAVIEGKPTGAAALDGWTAKEGI